MKVNKMQLGEMLMHWYHSKRAFESSLEAAWIVLGTRLRAAAMQSESFCHGLS